MLYCKIVTIFGGDATLMANPLECRGVAEDRWEEDGEMIYARSYGNSVAIIIEVDGWIIIPCVRSHHAGRRRFGGLNSPTAF